MDEYTLAQLHHIHVGRHHKQPALIGESIAHNDNIFDFSRSCVQVHNQMLQKSILKPWQPAKSGLGRGSGVVIEYNGTQYIVTNHHVINQAQLVEISVPFIGEEKFEVNVVIDCPYKDLAFLQPVQPIENLIPIALGNCDHLKLGRAVSAIGFPLGQNGLKVTTGVFNGYQMLRNGHNMIQLDAALNHGNSGGGAIMMGEDGQPQLMGINASIMQGPGVNNIGYAIPIHQVLSVLEDYAHTKQPLIAQPNLGARFQGSNAVQTEYLQNPPQGGYYVNYVLPGSVMDNGGKGLQKGMQIYKVNGYPVTALGEVTVPWADSKVSMKGVFDRSRLGDNLQFDVYHKGAPKRINVTYQETNPFAVRRMRPPYNNINYTVFGGMVVAELTQDHVGALMKANPTLTKYMNPEHLLQPALIISFVFPGSKASRIRTMGPGQLLTRLNGTPVNTLDDFKQVLQSKPAFVAFENQFHGEMVLKWDDARKEDQKLCKVFGYAPSELYRTTKVSSIRAMVDPTIEKCGCGVIVDEAQDRPCKCELLNVPISFDTFKNNKGEVVPAGQGTVRQFTKTGLCAQLNLDDGSRLVVPLKKCERMDNIGGRLFTNTKKREVIPPPSTPLVRQQATGLDQVDGAGDSDDEGAPLPKNVPKSEEQADEPVEAAVTVAEEQAAEPVEAAVTVAEEQAAEPVEAAVTVAEEQAAETVAVTVAAEQEWVHEAEEEYMSASPTNELCDELFEEDFEELKIRLGMSHLTDAEFRLNMMS